MRTTPACPSAALEYRFTHIGIAAHRGRVLLSRPQLHGHRHAELRRPADSSRRLCPVERRARKTNHGKQGAFRAAVHRRRGQGQLCLVPRGHFDPLTMAWKDVQQCACYDRPADYRGRSRSRREPVRAASPLAPASRS